MRSTLSLAFVVPLMLVSPSAQSVGDIVGEAEALDVRTGVVACDPGARGSVLAHRAQEAFLPASNHKLLTAIGALAALGPEFRFRTTFRVRGGWLEVEGRGDPNWETGTEHDPAAIFARVAAHLRDRGIGAVRGVRLLPGSFTGPIRPPSWPNDQLETYYCAPTGAHVLDGGCFRARIVPTTGAEARVELLAPAAGAGIGGAIKMSTARNPTYGLRDAGGQLVAHGAIRKGAAPVEVHGAVADPAAWYERALRAALGAAGIAVDPAAPGVDAELVAHETPLAPALARMLEDSSNFHAEQILRVLGAEAGDGSIEGGVRALRAALERLLGTLPGSLRIADGSGLSRENTLTPELLARALERALAQPWRGALLDAMARPGAEGTLERRFARTPLASRVRAKTGWIRGVSALSGVVTRADGSLRVFVILMNYDPKLAGLNNKLKTLQERIVAALAAHDP